MWHRTHAEEAVEALASAGFAILGLDVRQYFDDGTFIEAPWSAFEPHRDDPALDADRGRQAALNSLLRLEAADLDEYEWVLITW
jgi:hypothetical protein